jgi:protein dithiol oxidoreductase (disulfide-forming)
MFIRSIVLALVCVVLSVPLRAAELVEGTDYRTLEPAQHSDAPPGKIEVLEFFSYGCPHCYEFYPLISAWEAKLPKDVVFKRVATGMGRTAWTNLAKAYYTLESTGDLNRLDAQIFRAIHEEHAPLFDEKAISEWAAKHGVEQGKFITAFDSFGVNTKLNQAEKMVESYKIDGVPAIAVGGQYVVIANSFEQMLGNASALIAKVRAERGGAAAAPAAAHK